MQHGPPGAARSRSLAGPLAGTSASLQPVLGWWLTGWLFEGSRRGDRLRKAPRRRSAGLELRVAICLLPLKAAPQAPWRRTGSTGTPTHIRAQPTGAPTRTQPHDSSTLHSSPAGNAEPEGRRRGEQPRILHPRQRHANHPQSLHDTSLPAGDAKPAVRSAAAGRAPQPHHALSNARQPPATIPARTPPNSRGFSSTRPPWYQPHQRRPPRHPLESRAARMERVPRIETRDTEKGS